MNWKALLTIFIFLAGILMASVGDAEAARFGGGRSFGSKPSMQRSTVAPPTRQTPPVAGATAGAAAQKSGLLGGMGGMFGGLLAGTLLGSLLFGGGFNGGGLMDILLIGILLFVAYKLFTRFRANRPVPAGGPAPVGPAYAPDEEPAGMQRQNTGMNWSSLEKRSDPGAVPVAPEITVPAGFDSEEFLRGAKLAFTRLQASWDKRDLEDIAQFTSPAVLQEVRNQFETDPAPSRTEILLVNARLLNVKEENGEQTASVFFDALLREAPSTDTTQVREVWHFVRPLNENGSWKLDGIQQVE